MAEDGWVNWPEVRRLSRHLWTSLAALAVFLVPSFIILKYVDQPFVRGTVEIIDGIVFIGIIAGLGRNILKDFWKNGSSYVFASLA
jgi:hypothetical protein